eukprot:TRINITY_DN29148_c1_g1_i1.p1 TRINITY_DN29148_c1_g1~~TRINITY_DN29148_c1_g1_i1.p1  ORF type:complete len:560 (-),score=91.01 TRINITY_DN29148_c1_g1_i1:58-1737(-)
MAAAPKPRKGPPMPLDEPLLSTLACEGGPVSTLQRQPSNGSKCSKASTPSYQVRPYGLESPHITTKVPLFAATQTQLTQQGQHSRDLDDLEEVDQKEHETWLQRVRHQLYRLYLFTGPGWLMSIAYVDPGNLEADLQSGAQFGYTLLWALFYATMIGLAFQLVAARLGCSTGKHLAEHCRSHFSPVPRIVLWLLTETAIIGSDIQEVIGCSIGLQILFGLPLSTGVLVTAAVAFSFLFLERFGVRKLELFFGILIAVLAFSMGGLFSIIRPDKELILHSVLVPDLNLTPSAVQQVVGMVGCVVMPHNLFLHSALVQSRVIDSGEEREAIFLFTIESTLAILTSLLINVSVVAVFAKGFYGLPGADQIGLKNAGQFLGEAFGEPLRIIWALGLVAAGQSSTMTGAYAGQWVMQGYLDLKVVAWKRAIITRGMALVPCLVVAKFFGGETNSGMSLDSLNGYLNVLQSFVLPFALVPLVVFASSENIMGEDLRLARYVSCFCWIATGVILLVNVHLVVDQFQETVPSGVLVAGLLVYLSGVAYIWCAARRGSLAATPKALIG